MSDTTSSSRGQGSRKRYTGLKIIVVLVLLLAAGAYYLSTQVEKPVFEKVDVKIAGESGEDTIRVKFDLTIFNPNSFDINFDSIEYKLLIENETDGTGMLHHAISLRSDDRTSVKLPLDFVKGKRFKKAVKDDRDSVLFTLQLKGYVHVKKYDFSVSYSIDQMRPLFKTIKATIDSIKIERPGLKTTDVTATISLYNPNMIRFHCKRLTYEMYDEDKVMIQGEKPINTVLKPKSSIVLKLPLEIKSGMYLRDMVLFKKRAADKTYKIAFHLLLMMDTNEGPPKAITLDLERKGTLEELHHAMAKK